MKKFWAALLTVLVLLGLLNAAAVAEKMENVRISDVLYHDSGYLKGFTLSGELGNGGADEFRVSVQTKQFRKQVEGNSNGDFTNFGEYAKKHPGYTTWPEKPEDCGFISWAGDTFRRPEGRQKEMQRTVTFDDGVINCSKTQTYHMYLWVKYNYNGYKVYPDAFVTSFTTGGGTITGEDIKTNSVQPKDPSNDSSNNPPKGPTNDSSNIPPSNSSNAAQDIPATVDLPKTGDDSQMVLWLAMSLLAGAGLLALTRRRASER